MKKILRASAGTGKTYRLSLEYILALLKGYKYEDIIVMTFTNKATEEIRERIIKFLYELAYETKEGEKILASLKDVETSLEVNVLFLKNLYKEILINKEKLKISTIDGFKNLIFKSSVALVNNIYSSEIINDNQNEEILKKCLEKILEDEKLFLSLQRFFELKIERDINKHIETLKMIVGNRWKYILIKTISKLEDKKPLGSDINKMVDLLDQTKSSLEELLEYKGKSPLEDFVNGSYRKYLNLKTKNEAEKYFKENWKELINKNYYDGRRIKTSKKDEYNNEKIEEITNLKEEFSKELAKKVYDEEILPYEKEVLSFIEIFYSIYDEIKFREKKFTHGDILDYVLLYLRDESYNIIHENLITSYMKEVLESECKIIFIDEFQDTSLAQWKMLEPFIETSETSIFVGDEKQSIYGWRGGDKKLFEKIKNLVDGQEEELDTSYRSETEIIDFTNEIFEKISNYGDINWKFNKIKSAKEEKEGLIEIYNCGEKDDNEEKYLKELVNLLKNKLNGNYKGIGIIARDNKTLNEVASFLTEERIPYFLETNLNIFNHRGVIPVLSLLSYFKYKNKIDLLEFLRDDIILIGDDFFKKIILLKEENEVEDNLKNIIDIEGYPEEKILIKKILSLYLKYSEREFKDLELILDIIKEFGILEVYNKENDVKNIYKFLEISKNFETISDILDEVDSNSDSSSYKQIGTEDKEGITLLTIHKSKGLEFDTVIYIYNDGKSSGSQGFSFDLKISDDYKKIDEYLMTNRNYEDIFERLDKKYNFFKRNNEKEEEEEINNLYVGLTRARGNLIILIKNLSKSKKVSEILKRDYINEDERFFTRGSLKIYEEEKTKEDLEIASKMIIDFGNNSLDLEKLQEIKENSEINNLEKEEKRNIGNIYHYFLEQIKYGEEKEVELAKIKTKSRFSSIVGQEKINELLGEKQIKKILEVNQDIFSKNWDVIHTEYEIYSDTKNKLYRIDRLMIDNTKKIILIVDYKTGLYNENQLENYKILVEQELEKLGLKEKYQVIGRYIEI